MSLILLGRRLQPDDKSEDLPVKIHSCIPFSGVRRWRRFNMVIKKVFTLALTCVVAMSVAAQSKLDSLQHVREIIVVSKPAMREVVPSQKLKGELLEQLNTHSVAPYAISQVSS